MDNFEQWSSSYKPALFLFPKKFKNFLDIEDIFDSKTDPKCANVPENLQLLFFLRKWGVGGWVKGCLELFQKIIRFGEGWLP